MTAPADSRLPNGGGYTSARSTTSCPAKSGQVDNLATLANKYGDWYQYFNGFDVTVSLRQGGLTFRGAPAPDRTSRMTASVRANLPELNTGIGAGLVGSTVSTTSPYCHVAYGMLTQLRGLASYAIPKIDAQVSAVFQSKPGAAARGQLRDARLPRSRSSSAASVRKRDQRHHQLD